MDLLQWGSEVSLAGVSSVFVFISLLTEGN